MKKRTFELNKLVRDKVFDDMLNLRQKPEYKNLTGLDKLVAMGQKVGEESGELSEDPGELADVKQITEDFIKELKLFIYKSKLNKQVQQEQKQKLLKNGGFRKGIYVGKLTVDANDEWADYYAKDPKRFPETKD